MVLEHLQEFPKNFFVKLWSFPTRQKILGEINKSISKSSLNIPPKNSMFYNSKKVLASPIVHNISLLTNSSKHLLSMHHQTISRRVMREVRRRGNRWLTLAPTPWTEAILHGVQSIGPSWRSSAPMTVEEVDVQNDDMSCRGWRPELIQTEWYVARSVLQELGRPAKPCIDRQPKNLGEDHCHHGGWRRRSPWATRLRRRRSGTLSLNADNSLNRRRRLPPWRRRHDAIRD